MDASNYSLIGNPNSVVASIFKGKSNDPQNVFYNVEVKTLSTNIPMVLITCWVPIITGSGSDNIVWMVRGHHKNTHSPPTADTEVEPTGGDTGISGRLSKMARHLLTGQVMYNTWKVQRIPYGVVMPNRNVSVTA